MFRLGIVGVGTIAKDYIGLIATGKVKDANLAALCSRRAEPVRQLTEQYGLHARYYQDYERMLADGGLDGVIVCTPHGMHPAMTVQALEAGKHVLVEKPVGIYADEVQRAIDVLSARPELVCGVLYNRRASKAFSHVRRLMEQGRIGELVRCTWVLTDLYRTCAYYRSGSWRGSWQSEGGGLLMTQASHQLDLLQWICGMPSSVMARCSTVERPIAVENEAELFFTFPNGAHGHFIASAHECPGVNRLEICGTRGRITVTDDTVVEIVRLVQDERDFARACPAPFEKVPYTVDRQTFDDGENTVQQAATIQNFIRAAQGQEPIQCSLAQGLRSLQIIHGAYLSHWQGGREVALPVDEALFRQKLRAQNR